ncbi:TetR/AcrR family transcriptional regulator [Nocardia nova]|uniref:TetR/AcrR family transcriptional regulator n=1 Tax=Nocardia nova TaxID=37330 RepID=UPI0033D74C4A
MDTQARGTGVQGAGLRERKKLETARSIWAAAIGLFTEHGFDNVSVAQIAEAANVSKMTVFNYYATKEELILRPLEEHVDEPASLMCKGLAGSSSLRPLREFTLAAIAKRDPIVGMSASPQVLEMERLVRSTSALDNLRTAHLRNSEEQMAAVLSGRMSDVVARLAGTLIVSTLRTLRAENVRALLDGATPDEINDQAVANANVAFDILERGLAPHFH